MQRGLALALSLLLTWALTQIAPPEASYRVTALALGVALIAAAIAGELIVPLGLPRVTGYLIFGLLCGPYLANIITRPMARELQLVNGLAVTLIAFVAGLEMNLRRLAPRLGTIVRVGGVTMGLSYAVLFGALWLAWPWIGIAPAIVGLQRVAAAALLTALVASFSPTVTIAIVAESRAAGPLTELTLAIVILADLVLIFAFTILMHVVHFAFGGAADVGLFAGVTWDVLGSLAFGGLCGAALSLYLVFVRREVPLVVLGFCAVVAGTASRVHLEPLVCALAAGMVVENLAESVGDVVKDAVEKGALPVLVVFFAAAGASLQLDALATLGWIAVAISAARMALIWLGADLGRRAAGLDNQASHLAWMGMVSQAGVTLGLALIVAGEFPAWGPAVQTLVLALIALHQLVGPVLFRTALARAGEIGGMDNTGMHA